MHELQAAVRRYDWGSRSRLHRLTQQGGDEPIAEMWFSRHPIAPSPMRWICGPTSCEELPVMVKLLAIDAPLSIQVHPTDDRVAQAKVGKEDCNFPDPAGKRETLLALEPVDICAGIAPAEQVRALLPPPLLDATTARRGPLDVEQFSDLVERIHSGGGELLEDFDRLLARARTGRWARLVMHLQRARLLHPGDPHAMSLALLAYRRLNPGEYVNIPPGVPHSYLEGLGLEVTSRSENIARAGLTRKETDVPCFLSCLTSAAVASQGSVGPAGAIDTCVRGVTLRSLGGPHTEASADSVVLGGEEMGGRHRLTVPLAENSYLRVRSRTITAGSALLACPEDGEEKVSAGGWRVEVSWSEPVRA